MPEERHQINSYRDEPRMCAQYGGQYLDKAHSIRDVLYWSLCRHGSPCVAHGNVEAVSPTELEADVLTIVIV